MKGVPLSVKAGMYIESLGKFQSTEMVITNYVSSSAPKSATTVTNHPSPFSTFTTGSEFPTGDDQVDDFEPMVKSKRFKRRSTQANAVEMCIKLCVLSFLELYNNLGLYVRPFRFWAKNAQKLCANAPAPPYVAWFILTIFRLSALFYINKYFTWRY